MGSMWATLGTQSQPKWVHGVAPTSGIHGLNLGHFGCPKWPRLSPWISEVGVVHGLNLAGFGCSKWPRLSPWIPEVGAAPWTQFGWLWVPKVAQTESMDCPGRDQFHGPNVGGFGCPAWPRLSPWVSEVRAVSWIQSDWFWVPSLAQIESMDS